MVRTVRKNFELSLLEGIFLAYLPSMTARIWKMLPPRTKLALIAGVSYFPIIYSLFQFGRCVSPLGWPVLAVWSISLTEIAAFPHGRLLNSVARRLGIKRNASTDVGLVRAVYSLLKGHRADLRSLAGRLLRRIPIHRRSFLL